MQQFLYFVNQENVDYMCGIYSTSLCMAYSKPKSKWVYNFQYIYEI
jgi:hypothetical protein